MMRRCCAILSALVSVAPSASGAAELTRIVSSFEEGHPFGFSLEAAYQFTQERSKIVREAPQDGKLGDMPELIHVAIDHRLIVEARIGLWRDLEFKFAVPFVFAQDRTWRYAGGTNDANSTVANNCIRANGELLDANCPTTGSGRQPIFNSNSNSYRGGVGDMTFGIAYAIFNQQRDDTKPMWILGLDYTAPTASALDPTVPTTSDSRGDIGERIHRYKFYTSLSRRIGALDPYFQMHYTLPVRGPGWYSNCDHPNPENMAHPENCADPAWSRADTGIQPPHTAGVIFGSEFNFIENRKQHSRLAVDLRATATYFSHGRYYNELSDLLGKLLYSEEYLQYGGGVGLIAQVGPVLTLQLRSSLVYDTPHFLTSEAIGKDLDNDGRVDITGNPREVNPNFDFRTDVVSRRFRATEVFIFQVDASARVNF
jgi:hypothetical protein